MSSRIVHLKYLSDHDNMMSIVSTTTRRLRNMSVNLLQGVAKTMISIVG